MAADPRRQAVDAWPARVAELSKFFRGPYDESIFKDDLLNIDKAMRSLHQLSSKIPGGKSTSPLSSVSSVSLSESVYADFESWQQMIAEIKDALDRIAARLGRLKNDFAGLDVLILDLCRKISKHDKDSATDHSSSTNVQASQSTTASDHYELSPASRKLVPGVDDSLLPKNVKGPTPSSQGQKRKSRHGYNFTEDASLFAPALMAVEMQKRRAGGAAVADSRKVSTGLMPPHIRDMKDPVQQALKMKQRTSFVVGAPSKSFGEVIPSTLNWREKTCTQRVEQNNQIWYQKRGYSILSARVNQNDCALFAD